MINKIAETHFNTLRAASAAAGKPEVSQTGAMPASHDALNTFMSSPSFNTKQIAIESLLRQITQGSRS